MLDGASFFVPLRIVGGGEDRRDGSGVIDSRGEIARRTIGA